MASTAKAVPARFDRAAQHRRALMAKIHVAKKQLLMDEDDYRQILLDETGKQSLKQCSDKQLELVVSALKRKGFQPIQRKGVAMHPMARKARALWVSLYHLGVVRNKEEEALEAFAKRQLGCDRLIWARQSDANRLIEALKAMAVRAGWIQHDPVTGKHLAPLTLQSSLCQVILAKLKKAGEVPQDWALHQAMWQLCGIENARDAAWSAEDYVHLAAALGRKLRAATPDQGEIGQ